jgi:hypothetical protein
MKLDKNGGNLAGIMIFLLVRTLSARGTIIAKDTPSKMADKPIQIVAIVNFPAYGLINFNNFR